MIIKQAFVHVCVCVCMRVFVCCVRVCVCVCVHACVYVHVHACILLHTRFQYGLYFYINVLCSCLINKNISDLTLCNMII